MKNKKTTLKNSLLASIGMSSLLLLATHQYVLAEEVVATEATTQESPQEAPVNVLAEGTPETSETPESETAFYNARAAEETAASEEASDDFERSSFHLGKITNAEINENIVNIDYETGQKGRLYFYDDNVIRYYVDKNGDFKETPAPSRPDRPAEIVVKKLSDYEKISPTLTQDDKKVRIETSAIFLELDKVKSTLKIINKATNKVVLEEAAPLEVGNTSTKQTLKAGENTQYFGGGTQNGRFTHKGEAINIVNENNWVDGGVASPNPFYWTTDGYGVLRHTFKPGRYDFENSKSNRVETVHNEGRFDAFYFINDTPTGLLKDYYKLTGDPAVLPIFSLYQGHLNAYNRDYWVEVPAGTPRAVYFEETGKWYREYQPNQLGNRKGILETLNGNPGDENYPFTARAIIDRYKKHDMPLGWMLTNDGYGAGYGQTDSLEGNIENLRKFSEYARQNGVESGLWTQSDLHPKEGVEPLLQRDLPNEVEKGLVRILKTDVAWVGPGYSFGLNGITDAAKIMTEKGDNARPFIISLDGWAGTQRHAGIWTGDQTGGEWEYIRFHIPTYIGTGLSGNPNVSSDMDGIFGGGNKIINTRDFQWKAFTTMMLNMDGWGYNPKNPYAFDKTTSDINRSYLKLKSALVPYSYSLAHEAVDGMPIIQAMFLQFPDEAINYSKAVQYQYMYGKNFLVAPVYENVKADEKGNDVRNGIYLPKGEQWIDFFTGEIYEGGKVLNNFEVPIWKQPIFVRNGAIIPVTKPHNNYKEIDHSLRQVNFYPHGSTDFTLFEDDGLTEGYKQGKVAKTLITSTLEGDKATLTINRTDNKFNEFVKEKASQFNVNVSKRPTAVRLFVENAPVELREVSTLAEFEAGNNVYFYDATPNLNQFSTEGGDFYNTKITKNPVLRVKSAKLDVTKNTVKVEVDGFEMNKRHTPEITKEEGTAPTPTVTDENRTPSSIKVTWNEVANATSYELLVDGVHHTNVKSPEFLHRDLKFNTSHTYKVRAVVGDAYTQWSDAVTAETKEDPLMWAIDKIKVSSRTPAQGSQPLKNLVDKQIHTEYHSRWSVETAVPEDLVFDLGMSYDLDKLVYYPRTAGVNGVIRQAEVYVSDDYRNWQKVEKPISWPGNNKAQTLELPENTRGRYVWMKVTGTAGGNKFVSGNEMLIFRKEGTQGRVVGDVSGNRTIDENDVTSFLNYAGLRRGIDRDFEGYVEVADLNKNNVIDAYDIYYVTRQLGDGEAKPSRKAKGNLTWTANKESVKQGEEVVFTLSGSQLEGVEAIYSSFNIDKNLYEVVDKGVTIDPSVSTMENFSRIRTHGDASREAFVILTNRKNSPSISGDHTIATVRLRALRDHNPTITPTESVLLGSDLNPAIAVVATPENEATVVPSSRIKVTGSDVYQSGNNVDKLIDGNLGTLTELLWDISANHVDGKLPDRITLPQDITFTFSGEEPTRLQAVELHKRTPGNGTVTKYRLATYLGDTLVHQSEDIVVPFEEATPKYTFATPQDVDRVVLTVLEAKPNPNTVNNKMMTLKEVKFYEVARTDEETSTAEKDALMKVASNRIRISGSDVYQGGRGVDKLIDGNPDTLTELKWDISANHVDGKLPANISLPQAITLELSGDTPTHLKAVVINKRTPGNGTVTKYKVDTYLKDKLVHSSGEQAVAFEQADIEYVLANPVDVDKVVVTVLEAKQNPNTVNNQMMTLREITLYEVERPATNPVKLVHTDEATKVTATFSDKESTPVTAISVTRVEDFGKDEGIDVDVYSIGALKEGNTALTTTQPVSLSLPVPAGKKVLRIMYVEGEDPKFLEFTTESGKVKFTTPKLTDFYVQYAPAVTLVHTDEATKVTATFSDKEPTPVAAISVTRVEDYDKREDVFEKLDVDVYNVAALKEGNAALTTTQSVALSLPVPEGKKVIRIMYVEGEEPKFLEFTTESGKVKFTTPKLAEFYVQYERVVKEETEEIPFETVYEEDATVEEGTETVKVEGVVGTRRILKVNGKEVSRDITKQPVNKVIVRGTKKAEVAKQDEVSAKGTGVTTELPVAEGPIAAQNGGSVTVELPTAEEPIVTQKGDSVTVELPIAETPKVSQKGTSVTTELPVGKVGHSHTEATEKMPTSEVKQSTSTNDKALPETGEESAYGIFGALALTIMGTLGLVSPRKKEQ